MPLFLFDQPSRKGSVCSMFSSFLVGCNVNVPQALLPGAWNQTELHVRSRHSCLLPCACVLPGINFGR